MALGNPTPINTALHCSYLPIICLLAQVLYQLGKNQDVRLHFLSRRKSIAQPPLYITSARRMRIRKISGNKVYIYGTHCR